MPIRTNTSGIPRGDTRKGDSTDGPSKDERNSGLATTTNGERRSGISGIHRILPIFHPELFENRPPPHTPHKKGRCVQLGGTTGQSIRNIEVPHVRATRATATRLQQTLLPLHRRIRLRHGSRTLTGGRTKPTHQKTHATPHSILLGHLHPHRTKLRYLRTRATGSHKSPDSLETTLSSDPRSSHNPHGPCEPHLLEIPQESQQEGSTMVHRATRLPSKHKTRPREAARSSGPTVPTTGSGPRRERQLRRDLTPKASIRQIGKRTRPTVDLHRSPGGEGAATTTSIHGGLATALPTRIHEIGHGTPATTVDERGQNGRSPRQSIKARPRPPRSQQTDRRTHGKGLDPLHALERCLVAGHESLGGRIHQGVRSVSTKQKHQQKITNPTLQNHSSPTCPTV